MASHKDEETIQVSMRLPKTLNDRLDAEARRRVLGKARLVELILRPWLDENEGKGDVE